MIGNAHLEVYMGHDIPLVMIVTVENVYNALR